MYCICAGEAYVILTLMRSQELYEHLSSLCRDHFDYLQRVLDDMSSIEQHFFELFGPQR